MTLYFWPAPHTAQTYAGIYNRQMRRILVQDYTDGKITVTGNSTTVTGIGTAWTSRMEGSVIRFSTSKTLLPTSQGGANPFDTERMVVTVNSGTSLTIDSATGTAYTECKHRISDPVDVYEGNMQVLLLRECEKQFRMLRRFPSFGPEEGAEYDMAKVLAGESDSRSFEPRVAYGPYARWHELYRLPLRYYPFQDGN